MIGDGLTPVATKRRCMGCGIPGATREPAADEVRLVTIRAPGATPFGWRLCFACLEQRDELLRQRAQDAVRTA
jgi:hypothetical protein